ncbi:MAG TPA: palindromic element RPE4 domain-containing protein [Rickettsia endosymbiont of Pyrocoelia pectoralis]|nr:palindromic element RPE4 domain-containing protein [Rickettsia endosymbiont of Pyrocoelia pectoralis]
MLFHNRHCERAKACSSGSIVSLSSRDLFTGSSKTCKKFSFLYVYCIKYFFLDTVDKPRYDTKRVF